MHEFSLAQSILNSILSTAKKNNAHQVFEADLEVGEACPIHINQLIPFIIRLAENTGAANIKINVEEVKAEVKCNSCSRRGPAVVTEGAEAGEHRLPVCACSFCGSLEAVTLTGKDLKVKSIKVADEAVS